MPSPANPLEIIREFHTDETRERLIADADEAPVEKQPRRRWAPSRKHDIQRFFPEWPSGSGWAVPSSTTPRGAGASA